MIPVDRVNKALLLWAAVCSLFLSIAVKSAAEQSSTKFFTFGPREDLVILDVKINTGAKYAVVIFYTVISTLARTVLQEIVSPWLIQTIQNDKAKDLYARRHAQEVAIGEVIYRWFDWFMYMHILMAQIDMMIVELVGNLLAVIYTTRMYMLDAREKEVVREPMCEQNGYCRLDITGHQEGDDEKQDANLGRLGDNLPALSGTSDTVLH
jgi:hypothetical protein